MEEVREGEGEDEEEGWKGRKMRRACFCNDRRNDWGCQLSGDQNFPGGVILEIGKWKISRDSVQAPKDQSHTRYQFNS